MTGSHVGTIGHRQGPNFFGIPILLCEALPACGPSGSFIRAMSHRVVVPAIGGESVRVPASRCGNRGLVAKQSLVDPCLVLFSALEVEGSFQRSL